MPGEPPLSDRELRIVRGMMDEYANRQAVDRWFYLRWRFAAKLVAILSAAAVTVAAIEEIARTFVGR